MLTIRQDGMTEPIALRLRNASDSVLAYPAFLAGYRTVNEAMQDGFISSYLHTFLTTTTKSLTTPAAVDVEISIDQLLSQYTRSAVSDPLSALCADGASRLTNFVIPTLLDQLEQGKDVSSLAFLIAAYGHYLQAGVDTNGETYTVYEPLLTDRDWVNIHDSDVLALLDCSPFAGTRLRSYPRFIASYKSFRNQIACYGLVFSLKQTLCAFWEEADNQREAIA